MRGKYSIGLLLSVLILILIAALAPVASGGRQDKPQPDVPRGFDVRQLRPVRLLSAFGTVLLFLLLNIEIADFFAELSEALLLTAAVINIHHFVVDRYVWRLRRAPAHARALAPDPGCEPVHTVKRVTL